ncbi:MAG: hypothetical protein WCW31_03570 [Patescibacteria group bacterium]
MSFLKRDFPLIPGETILFAKTQCRIKMSSGASWNRGTSAVIVTNLRIAIYPHFLGWGFSLKGALPTNDINLWHPSLDGVPVAPRYTFPRWSFLRYFDLNEKINTIFWKQKSANDINGLLVITSPGWSLSTNQTITLEHPSSKEISEIFSRTPVINQ